MSLKVQDFKCPNPECSSPTELSDIWVTSEEGKQIAVKDSADNPIDLTCQNCGSQLNVALNCNFSRKRGKPSSKESHEIRLSQPPVDVALDGFRFTLESSGAKKNN